MNYKFYETKLFIIIAMFILCAVIFAILITGVNTRRVGLLLFLGFGFIIAPRLRAQTRFKESKELDTSGQTMLFNAYLREDAQRYIDEGTDIDSTDLKGQTPLHTQVEMDHSDIVKLLIDYHADVNKATGRAEPPSSLQKVLKPHSYSSMLMLISMRRIMMVNPS